MKKIGWLLPLLVCGCTDSGSAPPPITAKELVGTWNGTSSVGKTYQYTFAADGSFQYGIVHAGMLAPLANGTYTAANHTLTIDTTITDESGAQHHVQTTSDAYANGSAMCDSAMYPDVSRDGIAATWTANSTDQDLDANTAPVPHSFALSLSTDGSVYQTQDSVNQYGTYTQTGDQITVTFSSGHVSAVRTFTLVDDAVLCDPAYAR